MRLRDGTKAVSASEGAPRLRWTRCRHLKVAPFGLLLCLLFAPAAAAQISPGPLSKAHQFMGGSTECTRCHAVSPGSPDYRCLECHTEIASRLRARRGLHANFLGTSYSDTSCIRCHSEHNGRDFSIVKWDPTPGHFDHTKAGFPLDGKHAGLACNRCHNPQRILPTDRVELKNKDLNHTFLGLSPSCTSCHEDKHRGQLGGNCLQCHNAVEWKALTFSHAKTRYPLTGAHLQVNCQKCHIPSADGTPKWVGLKFERCSSCHNDIHKGAFQQTCESCHSTGGWKRTSVATHFDHSKTKYPLVGKHLEVNCGVCHKAGDFKTAIAHETCADCHHPDPHNGQFVRRADGGRCDSCHTLDGFKPAKFTVVDHNTSGFALHGAHAKVPCAKCHIPKGPATLYKIKFALCTDCHQDVHRGQFAAAPYFNRCASCHDENGYRPSTFTLARHQKTDFPLSGGHLATACIDCHKPVSAPQTVVYRFENLACVSCHTDPHRGEFKTRMATLGSAGKPLGCEACHSTERWDNLEGFDHNNTKFALTGAHKAVECAGCHRPPNLERKLLNVNFGAAPSQCEACHDDPHGAQFAHGPAETHCAECHNTTKWRPSLFDHEKTAFPLKGAHENVRCAGCHVNFRTVSGKKVLFYKPTPTACASCHANGVTRKG